MKLAESFLLDTDHLRKHHVSLLVSHGYDLLALEVKAITSSVLICMRFLQKYFSDKQMNT